MLVKTVYPVQSNKTGSGDFYKNEESKISDYLSIIIFTLCGALALTSFGNMAMFFLGIEVLSISLYILAGSKRRDIRSNEAAILGESNRPLVSRRFDRSRRRAVRPRSDPVLAPGQDGGNADG